MPKVGLKAIAQHLGISAASVSYALNGAPGVSEDLRRQVQETAERLGYQPNHAGAALRAQRSWTVAFTKFASESGERTDPFLATILTSAAATLEAGRYDTLIHTIDQTRDPQLASLQRLFSSGRVDGAIVSAGRLDASTLRWLAERDAPIVTLEAAAHHPTLPGVGAQYQQGIEALVQHLARRGRTRIAFLAGDPTEHTARQRLRGYELGLRAAGLPLNPAWVGAFAYGYDAARAFVANLLDAGARPDAIMGATDRMAVAAIQELQARGLRVPEDVAVTGFDDSEFARYIQPHLTTARLHADALGGVAGRLMLQRLAGPVPVEDAHVLLPVEVIVRDSA